MTTNSTGSSTLICWHLYTSITDSRQVGPTYTSCNRTWSNIQLSKQQLKKQVGPTANTRLSGPQCPFSLQELHPENERLAQVTGYRGCINSYQDHCSLAVTTGNDLGVFGTHMYFSVGNKHNVYVSLRQQPSVATHSLTINYLLNRPNARVQHVGGHQPHPTQSTTATNLHLLSVMALS